MNFRNYKREFVDAVKAALTVTISVSYLLYCFVMLS